MKKQIVIPLCCVLSVAIIGGSIYGVMHYNHSKTVIDVLPVASLSTQYWEDSYSEGYVTSNVSQEITLGEKQVIKEIYIKEGDTVAVGDKLVAFDTTLTELDLEDKRISLQKIDLQIKDLNEQIKQIKENKVPVDTGITPNEITAKERAVNPVLPTAVPSIQVIEKPESQLDFNTQPTPMADAYEIVCDENTIITPEFINKIRGCDESGENQKPENAMVVVLKIADSGTGIKLNGKLLKAPEADTIPTRLSQFMKNNRRMDVYPTSGELNAKTDILTINDKNYVYCSPEMTITASFIKQLLAVPETQGQPAKDAVTVILKMKDHNDFILDGHKLTAPDESKIDTTTLKDYMANGQFNERPVEPETPDTQTPDTEGPGGDLPDINDPGIDEPTGPVYTPDEIKQLVTEKEQEIAKLKTSRKQAELDMKKLQKQLDASIITSSVNGIVKTSIDPMAENNGLEKGQPFVVVQSEEGLYLTGTLNELQLESIKVGHEITANSYMSGTSFCAKITEIADYPTDNQMSYSENRNVSYYPFKAYIENAEGLSNGEMVNLSMTSNQNQEMSEALFVAKAFVRQDDDGSSYVYVRDDKERLKKQTVITGRTLYSSFVEIKSGLTIDDYIAFPYGKTLKEGVKTKEGNIENMFY